MGASPASLFRDPVKLARKPQKQSCLRLSQVTERLLTTGLGFLVGVELVHAVRLCLVPCSALGRGPSRA